MSASDSESNDNSINEKSQKKLLNKKISKTKVISNSKVSAKVNKKVESKKINYKKRQDSDEDSDEDLLSEDDNNLKSTKKDKTNVESESESDHESESDDENLKSTKKDETNVESESESDPESESDDKNLKSTKKDETNVESESESDPESESDDKNLNELNIITMSANKEINKKIKEINDLLKKNTNDIVIENNISHDFTILEKLKKYIENNKRDSTKFSKTSSYRTEYIPKLTDFKFNETLGIMNNYQVYPSIIIHDSDKKRLNDLITIKHKNYDIKIGEILDYHSEFGLNQYQDLYDHYKNQYYKQNDELVAKRHIMNLDELKKVLNLDETVQKKSKKKVETNTQIETPPEPTIKIQSINLNNFWEEIAKLNYANTLFSTWISTNKTRIIEIIKSEEYKKKCEILFTKIEEYLKDDAIIDHTIFMGEEYYTNVVDTPDLIIFINNERNYNNIRARLE
jgi:hypothetical protein